MKQHNVKVIACFEDENAIPHLEEATNVSWQNDFQPPEDMMDALITRQDNGINYGNVYRINIKTVRSVTLMRDFGNLAFGKSTYPVRPGQMVIHAVTESDEDITLVATISWVRGFEKDCVSKQMTFGVSVVAPFTERVSGNLPKGMLSEKLLMPFGAAITEAFQYEQKHLETFWESIEMKALAGSMKKNQDNLICAGIYDGNGCVLEVSKTGYTTVYQQNEDGLNFVGHLPCLTPSCNLLENPEPAKTSLNNVFAMITVDEMSADSDSNALYKNCKIFFQGSSLFRLNTEKMNFLE